MKTKKVDVNLVKKLREETGGGVMDCRQALVETGGGFAKAKKWLEAKGAQKAAKRQGKTTGQGIVATYTHITGRVGVVAAVLCETDFVARNEDFRCFAKNICLQIAAMNPKNEKELLSQDYIREPGMTVEKFIKTHIAKFGENIKIGRFKRVEIK